MILPPQLPLAEIKTRIMIEIQQNPIEKLVVKYYEQCFEVDNDPAFCSPVDDLMRKTGKQESPSQNLVISNISTSGTASNVSTSPSPEF